MADAQSRSERLGCCGWAAWAQAASLNSLGPPYLVCFKQKSGVFAGTPQPELGDQRAHSPADECAARGYCAFTGGLFVAPHFISDD